MVAAEQHPLTASQEDYLETILGLMRDTGAARVRDIAGHLNVAKSSVTVALRGLSRRGLVNYKPYEMATLTAPGQAAAERIRRRHQALQMFLRDVLNVERSQAEADACRLEHAMGDAIMRRLSCFVEFMADSRVSACELPRAFREYCQRCRDRADGDLCRRICQDGDAPIAFPPAPGPGPNATVTI